MSSNSGGETGITSQYIRDAQDVTKQLRERLTYGNFTGTGATPYPWNYGNDIYRAFLNGRKECDGTCTGLPYQLRTIRLFR